MIFRILCYSLFAVGAYLFLNMILNGIFFRIIGNNPKKDHNKLVSVIVPARNEEKNLGRLLDSLCNQTYENIEILVINDQSTDSTGAIIEQYERKDSRVHGFATNPEVNLHKRGKINALLQLIPHARGSYYLATDADTVLKPDCIEYAYGILENRNVDFISGFPEQKIPGIMTKTCVSAMILSSSFVPHWLNWFINSSVFSVAIGQFIFMKKDAYEEAGGYGALDENIVCDDMGIAKLFAKKKKKAVFVDMSNHIRCFTYTNIKDAYYGLGRSIAGLMGTGFLFVLFIAAVLLYVLFISLAPAVWVVLFVKSGWTGMNIVMLAGILLLWSGWFISEICAKYDIITSSLYSVTFIHAIILVVISIARKITDRKYVWKGREV